jgi:hypothetical protein
VFEVRKAGIEKYNLRSPGVQLILCSSGFGAVVKGTE